MDEVSNEKSIINLGGWEGHTPKDFADRIMKELKSKNYHVTEIGEYGRKFYGKEIPMINILLNIYKIDAEWCFHEFKKYIKEDYRVTVIPFSYKEERINSDESWQAYYGENDGIYFHGIVNSFHSYGIKYENINWINYFADSKETAKNKILNSDILFFLGGLPDLTMLRIKEFDLVKSIEEYKGIIMGYSA